MNPGTSANSHCPVPERKHDKRPNKESSAYPSGARNNIRMTGKLVTDVEWASECRTGPDSGCGSILRPWRVSHLVSSPASMLDLSLGIIWWLAGIKWDQTTQHVCQHFTNFSGPVVTDGLAVATATWLPPTLQELVRCLELTIGSTWMATELDS